MFLQSPATPERRELDPRGFTAARRVRVPGPVSVPQRRRGRPMDFTLADVDMPVASRAPAERLTTLAPDAGQLVPARVPGRRAEFAIVNVLTVVDCLDEAATEIDWWTPEDGRPDRVGRYRMVVDPVIERARAGSAPLVRLGGWQIPLICTSALEAALEQDGFTGGGTRRRRPLASGPRAR